MARTLTPKAAEFKNRRDSEEPATWLLDISLSAAETLRIARGDQVVVYNSNTYRPFPFSVGSIKDDSEGNPAEVGIAIDHSAQDLSAIIERHGGFLERTITITLVGSGEEIFAKTFDIEQCNVTPGETVDIVLSNAYLFRQDFPKRRLFRGLCIHAYKGTDCGYTAALATCDKTFFGSNGCIKHDNADRYSGIPFLPKPA